MKKLLIFMIISSLTVELYSQDDVNDFIPDATYYEIEERLKNIESTVPLNYNNKVKGFIDYFTVKDREYTKGVLSRKDYYFAIFEKYLKKYNLPDELKYLAIVESGLRPEATSVSNAVGLWQFINSTGKIYGLDKNWYYDERMDIHKSTEAACKYLNTLYNMFDDWELALAAYNCGPGNIRKAIRRSGNKRTFWGIYNYLPQETRSYVPQFVAIMYTMSYAEEHNLYADEIILRPKTDTILVSNYLHIETFCNLLNVCMTDVLNINPVIKRGVIPDGVNNFVLNVPYEIKPMIVQNRKFLFDSASKVGKIEIEHLARYASGNTYGRTKQIYRVRKGDYLGLIAQKFNVKVSDVKSWNNINSNMIRVGQSLNIWILPTYTKRSKNLYTFNNTSNNTSTNTENKKEGLSDKKTYSVQAGDTLWSISKNTNTTVDKLKELNKLNDNTIKVGQELLLHIN